MSKEREKINKFLKYDILLIGGLPASGKTYLGKKFFFTKDRKRISRLEIRKALHHMFTFGEQWHQKKFDEIDGPLVKSAELRIIESLLDRNTKILVDNSSVTKASRVRYINVAKKYRKEIGLVFINIPIQKCFERNKQKPENERLPEPVITKLFSSLQLPKLEEGFDDVMVVSDY